MKKYLISTFTCLLAFIASGQVNLIDTLRLDSLASSSSYGIETIHKYVFNSNYGTSQQTQTQLPYMGNALISIDKATFQKTTRYHLNNGDTAWFINYLFEQGDTIRTIENAYYTDSSCNCKTICLYSNRYDENLHLLQRKTLDILKADSFFYWYFFLVTHNNQNICLATQRSISQTNTVGIYWLFDINSDSSIVFRKRITNYQDSIRGEMLSYISVNDSNDFLISGQGLIGNPFNGGNQLIKLKANNGYNVKKFFIPSGFVEPHFETIFTYNNIFSFEKNNYYYLTSWGECQQDSTATTNGYFKSSVPFIKCYSQDSLLIPFHGVCAPVDSTPFSQGIYDKQIPTALHPIRFINDHVFVDVHPTHMDNNSFNYNPCQLIESRMEIIYWDTSLSVIKRTWITHPSENFYISGFFQTQLKDLMVYGYMCTRDSPTDSTHLFAFLLDKNSGHLLSIFNANDFVSENDYDVYPNPFYEQITIKRPIAKSETFYLYDGFGKLVLTKTIEENKEQISTTNLAEGLYFYSIVNRNGERIKAGKVVKE